MGEALVWTERASADIEAIVRYIARRNPQAAVAIGLGIYDRVQLLLTHPQAGSVLDELREGGWRKLIYRRWKIIYTIRDEIVIVGRVWPAALGEADLTTPLD
jgi:plasmid stabilization system protein ParE